MTWLEVAWNGFLIIEVNKNPLDWPQVWGMMLWHLDPGLTVTNVSCCRSKGVSLREFRKWLSFLISIFFLNPILFLSAGIRTETGVSAFSSRSCPGLRKWFSIYLIISVPMVNLCSVVLKKLCLWIWFRMYDKYKVLNYVVRIYMLYV